jgi:hypothetical protein
MSGLFSWILIITAILLGANDSSWYWCIILATIGIPNYYWVKGSSTILINHLQNQGILKWLSFMFTGQILIMSALYGIGLLFR